MAITTWEEFKKATNTEKRLVARITAEERAFPFTVRDFWFSTKAGEIPGLPIPIPGHLADVPNLTYSSNEIGGEPADPSWSDLSVYFEDGRDMSVEQNGVFEPDFDTTWIVSHRSVSVWLGGEKLPFSEYQPIFTGICNGLERTDSEIIFRVEGNENQAYRKTIASSVIDAATWPDAGGNIGKTIPVCIGPCRGVEPICLTMTALQPIFIFHDIATGPYTSIFVYVDGVQLIPAQFTDNLDGTVTLNFVPTKTVTMTVFGLYGFDYWATKITNLLTDFADIPVPNINAVAVVAANIAFPISVNKFLKKETPVMDLIAILSEGFPATYGFQRSGVFSMKEITDPALAIADYVINTTTSNESPVAINNNSLGEKFNGEIIWRTTMSYYPNHKVIDAGNLSATLSPTQRQLFSTDWRKTKYDDVSILQRYPGAAVKQRRVRTLFVNGAQSLAEKWTVLFGDRREITTITVPSINLEYEIGQIVSTTFETKLFDGSAWYRHGYNQRKMMILGMVENYNDYVVTLRLWG
mgnify:CR=1 FL=1